MSHYLNCPTYKLNWMTISQRIDYFTSTLMYKTINKSSPNDPHNRFEYVKDKHQIKTRSAENGNLWIPQLSYKTEKKTSPVQSSTCLERFICEYQRLQPRKV